MLGFQSKIVKGAEQDAWISVILVSLTFHIIVWMMFVILKNSDGGDLVSLHRGLFGRWLGDAASLLFYGYILLVVITEIRTYVDILCVWVFPTVHHWELGLLILLSAVYIVSGGFRVVTGICFWGVIIPSLLLLSLYFPMKYAHWDNFLPMFNHSIPDYVTSARLSAFQFLGVEFLFLYYPFIKHNRKAQKWAHIAVAHTTILYLIFFLVTFAYFNVRQMEHTLWPTLILSKIISFPFLERFDYIYVFNWYIVILPICCVALWGGARIVKSVTGLKARRPLWLSAALVMIALAWINGNDEIESMELLLDAAGTVVVYGYIPLLFVWSLLLKSFGKKSVAGL